MFKVGDRVYWSDPDSDFASGFGKIIKMQHEPPEDDSVISLEMDSEGEVECHIKELVLAAEMDKWRMPWVLEAIKTGCPYFSMCNDLPCFGFGLQMRQATGNSFWILDGEYGEPLQTSEGDEADCCPIHLLDSATYPIIAALGAEWLDFLATKRERGISENFKAHQLAESARLWGRPHMNLKEVRLVVTDADGPKQA